MRAIERWQNMLTIGEFSKACGVTVKTLRHYDKIGLLLPNKVDTMTNYRYYSEEQISQMLLINRLKRYGLSLQRIQALLLSEEDLFPVLVTQKHVLSKEIQLIEGTLSELNAHLKDIERSGKMINYQRNYEITLVEREPVSIMSVRQEMNLAQYDQAFDRAFGQLFEKIGQQQVVPVGPAIAIYHDSEFMEEDTDIEVALPINAPESASRQLSGGLHIRTVHRGAYHNLSEAYAAIVEWMSINGYESVGAPFEIYEQSAMNDCPMEQWETAIYFPAQLK